MKKIEWIAPALCLGLMLGIGGCGESATADNPANNDNKTDLTTDIDKASYLLGFRQAEGLAAQTQGVLSPEAYLAGVADFVASRDNRVAGENQQQLMTAIQTAVTAKQQEANAGVIEAGDEYREAYKNKEGVVALPSGLLYEVITEGTGAKPGPTDTVTTHYHGTLIDGSVFDSSVDRGQPASFPVNGVIRGWTEALQLMGVGSKWRLVIPPELAYGDRGAGPKIGPGATLIFEVELLSID